MHEFVAGKTDGEPHLETAIGKIQQIYQGMSQAANAPNQGAALLGMLAADGGGGGGGGGASGAAAQFGANRRRRAEAGCGDAADRLAVAALQVTASGASTELSDAWQSKVVPLCQAAFNRYPFVAGARRTCHWMISCRMLVRAA